MYPVLQGYVEFFLDLLVDWGDFKVTSPPYHQGTDIAYLTAKRGRCAFLQ